MKCGRCEPDYCACDDFFSSLRALGRGQYDDLLLGGMTKGPTMKTIDAIAAEAMPFGSYVEVGEDGFARVDPTLECRGGVVKRPPGHRNWAEAGEAIVVATDCETIAAEIDGVTRIVSLIDGRISSPVPRPRRPKQYP